MSIHAQLTDRESQLAEDMAGVLDLLSRVMLALDQVVNLHYAVEKAGTLVERVERLEMHLEAAKTHAGKEPAIRVDMLKAAITESARHYHAGRALYPAKQTTGAGQ